MGYQVILRRIPADLHHDVFTKTLSLEDLLVSTVFGALAYGPPAMLNAWRRRFTTLRPLSPGVPMEFWPTHTGARVGQREPDVFLLDLPKRQALIVEAKRGPMPKTEDLTRQLIEEGLPARDTHRGNQLHLPLVTDDRAEPAAFAEVRRIRPRLYSSHMRHTGWAELCDFLWVWRSRRDCDAARRRMIDDALAVMAKCGR